MKVKMLVSRVGPSVNDEAGDVIEVGAKEGQRMIAAGQAVAYKAVERATKKTPVETATK
jgi:hypothetical protein